MNSFPFTPAQNANAERLWSKCAGDVLEERELPHIGVSVWFFCSVKNARCSKQKYTQKRRMWQFWARKSGEAEMLSDILIHLKGFPLQPSLCYNSLSLLWAKRLQPFFLAGRNAPRSWQAAHTVCLVVSLLRHAENASLALVLIVATVANEMSLF